MSTPLKERERAIHPPLTLSHDRFDYKKTPVRFAALYRVFSCHACREKGDHVRILPCALPSHLTVAVSEHPLAFVFGLALRLMREQAPHETVTIRAEEAEDGVALTLSVKTGNPAPLLTAFGAHADVFFDLAQPSHFKVALDETDGQVSYRLLLPYYDEASFEVRAPGESLILLALSEALSYPL